MNQGFNIGQNTLNGEPLFMSNDHMSLHTLVLGGTGRGKSKILELRIRYHIENNHGLMLP